MESNFSDKASKKKLQKTFIQGLDELKSLQEKIIKNTDYSLVIGQLNLLKAKEMNAQLLKGSKIGSTL